MIAARRMTTTASVLLALLIAPSSDRIRAQTTVELTDVPVENSLSSRPPAIAFDGQDVDEILGKEVRSSANENMGRVINVLVNRSGQTLAAVIDFGGFLGIGSRKIAVDWNLLRFTLSEDGHPRVTLELTRDQLKSAPDYKEGKSVVVLGSLLRPLNAETPD
jgi:hypothetical protein